MSDELNDMIQGFVEESHEAFDAIENDLLTIESNPEDVSIINGIFRVMHTIKGTAGFLGLDEVNQLSHKLESIFDQIRREELQITSDLMDTILPAIDLLKLMVFELLEHTKSDYDLPTTLETLEGVTQETLPSAGVLKVAAIMGPNSPLEEEEEVVSIDSEVQKEFVIEAEEHLEVIEENLLRLEKQPDDENSINEVFRGIHSIKGTSDYVNLKKITKLSHCLETIFDQIRKGTQRYDNNLADTVLKGVDLLRTLVFMLKMGENDSLIQIDDVLEQLAQFVRKNDRPPLEKVKPPVIVSESNNIFKAFENISMQQLLAIRSLGENFLSSELDAEELMVLHRSLKTLENGAKNINAEQVVLLTFEMDEIVLAVLAEEKGQVDMGALFMQQVDRLEREIERLVQNTPSEAPQAVAPKPIAPKSVEQEVRRVVATPKVDPSTTVPDQALEKVQEPEPAKAKKSLAPASSSGEIKTMRVDSERLDTFMNLIGELIIARNSYNHILSELIDQKLPPTILGGLRSVEGAFNRISEDLQTTLMEMRLVSVKTVFQKIPRIVRDISRKRNKKMQLQMIGENTEIDKSIIEMIGDPLVHIVRNSCDHGIESPEERLKAGKPETGSIILKASHLGSVIAIDIIDDGAGIDTERVLQKAIEKGLVSKEKAPTLDAKTINSFIFHAGFSTAAEVTDISGRGVGMDVVMTNINKVHGTVEIESEKGQGTQIRLLLPLTLAVIDALVVVEQNQKFAIPLEAVKETIEIKESELQYLKQKEAINLRGNIIGVSRLNKLLELAKNEPNPDRVLSIVFLQVGTRVIGIVVDDLCNQQEIVVKPLQGYLTRIPGISGSTILGSGEIILILEPTELIDLSAL
ncbi:MAG: hypothetical protein COB67_01645 [SAR324 cluster bacterium]|uniref:Chemotaxis protein CheA n=1 Tax=SAR324 cluster bacterium TaxID=2024889 RepID=A0A2A4TAD8_9DELT|nr:MAG: hypothetical protein COB67_01645 [SAR324 cluster bacterium]